MEEKTRTEITLQKAIDRALWLNFKHRTSNVKFKVLHSLDDHYLITIPERSIFDKDDFEVLPEDYSKMTYNHIKSIYSDMSLPIHWEEIKGKFATMDGEYLRFILHYKVPLEKFIRYELASRGHDEDHTWIGFEKAEEIWLK